MQSDAAEGPVVANGSREPPRPWLAHADACQLDYSSQNIDDIATPSDLKFDEEFNFDDPEIAAKRKEIEKCLENPDSVGVEEWRSLALTTGGLISDEYRRAIWPRLLDVRAEEMTSPPSLAALADHPEYGQVVLDVDRSLKRFPPGVPLARRLALQDQLTALILRVMSARPELCYYQGYHDVAITLLLVTGARAAFPLLQRLSEPSGALHPYMQRSMAPAQRLLRLVPCCVRRARPMLARRLAAAGAGTMFALPWVLTWFGHSLPRYSDVVRLYDAFLADHALLPLYVTTAILLHREQQIMECEIDMAAMHCLLSKIPSDLPWQTLLQQAKELLSRWPPQDLEADMDRMEEDEAEDRRREEAAMAERRRAAVSARRGVSAAAWRRRVPWRALAGAALLIGAALYYRHDLLSNGAETAHRQAKRW